MRAIAVQAGEAGTPELPRSAPDADEALVRVLDTGVDGIDRQIKGRSMARGQQGKSG